MGIIWKLEPGTFDSGSHRWRNCCSLLLPVTESESKYISLHLTFSLNVIHYKTTNYKWKNTPIIKLPHSNIMSSENSVVGQETFFLLFICYGTLLKIQHFPFRHVYMTKISFLEYTNTSPFLPRDGKVCGFYKYPNAVPRSSSTLFWKCRKRKIMLLF